MTAANAEIVSRRLFDHRRLALFLACLADRPCGVRVLALFICCRGAQFRDGLLIMLPFAILHEGPRNITVAVCREKEVESK